MLTRAVKLAPQNYRVLQVLGILRMRQKRYSEAEGYFRRTLEIEPGCSEAKAALQYLQQLRP
jgi:uncharacterized protein HemY